MNNMLNKWGDKLEERRYIEDFFDWLINLGDASLYDININKSLDEYHGIDRKQLEAERRQLLEECRKGNNE